MDPMTLMLIAAGLKVGGGLFGMANSNSANSAATDAQMQAINEALGRVEGYKKESMGYVTPYTQNAAQDFGQLRDLVQSGYFNTPAPVSYTGPNFAFNPAQGSASFANPTFRPLGLPPLPPRPTPPGPAAPRTMEVAPMPNTWGTANPAQIFEEIRMKPMSPDNMGIAQDPRSMIPNYGPNAWAGVPGAGIGMPQKSADFLRDVLGLDAFSHRIPWTPKPGGLPNASGPTVPVGPGRGPTVPGQFGALSFTPNRGYSAGRPY